MKRIGSVIFDTKNNKVVQFLAEDDTVTMVVKKEGDYATRWLSLDPLAAKYPSMSPYNFVGNSPILFIDPDGQKIVINALSRTNRIALGAVLTYMRIMSPTFRTIYKELKESENVHEIRDVAPIDYENLSSEEVYTYNKVLYAPDPTTEQAHDRAIQVEEMNLDNANGDNAAVLSNSFVHNQYLKENNLDPKAECFDDSNGIGEGSVMVFGIEAHRKKGTLFKLNVGIRRLAHEFRHMSDINKGVMNYGKANDKQIEEFKKKGIDATKQSVVESNGLETGNEVMEDISNKTGQTIDKKSSHDQE